MSVLKTEWLKLKRTLIKWLVFGLPVLLSSLLVWYFSNRKITPTLELSIFSTFFQVWAALVVPVGTGLLAGLMVQQEERAGDCWNLLSSKTSRTRVYLGKLGMQILLSSISTAFALGTLLLGLRYVLQLPVSCFSFLVAALIVEATTIPLLALHLWISLAWGMGPSIGMGGGGLLLGALMVTPLGDAVWPYIPWGWPVRLWVLPLFYLAKSKGISLSEDLFTLLMVKGSLYAVVFLLLLLVGGLVWFNKWEGRKTLA